MNYGRHPWKGNLIVETEIPSLEDLLKKMKTTREEAKTVMEKTKETMKRQYDKRTRPIDNRNKSGTCKRGNSRLLDIAFKTKPIKERTKGHFFNISNTYQHSRNTFKHVFFYQHCYQCLYYCCLPYLEPGNL